MLQITDLSKSFGNRMAVKGVSFHVKRGELFGLLGPNGAGKSTVISMICGLLQPDQGDVLVDGLSVQKQPVKVKEKIGVVPQDIALYGDMSALDNLLFWGQMYGLSRKNALKKAEDVLEVVGLADRKKEKLAGFSGGMKRRINIGAAIMHEPELLIMDEPTVGIDPQSRNHILEMVKSFNAKGMTVIYTSHYMEEVEYLCSRIAIMDEGEIIALGTKEELVSRLIGVSSMELKVDRVSETLVEDIKKIPGVTQVTREEEGLTIFAENPKERLGDVVLAAKGQGVAVTSLEVKEPNLETLFLTITGRKLRD